jgi:hypothetical protein
MCPRGLQVLVEYASSIHMTTRRPLADLLIRLLAQADAGLDVAHIPHRAAAHRFSLTEVHHPARRLVQNIALAPNQLRAQPGAGASVWRVERLGRAPGSSAWVEGLGGADAPVPAPPCGPGGAIACTRATAVPRRPAHAGWSSLPPRCGLRLGLPPQSLPAPWGTAALRRGRAASRVRSAPPAHLRPAQVCSLIFAGQQQRWAPVGRRPVGRTVSAWSVQATVWKAVGCCAKAVWRCPEVSGGVRRCPEVSGFAHLRPPQFDGRLHMGGMGGEFLAERLHTLAAQRILPAFARLLHLAGAEPPPLR